jgi:hypothetical protein
LETPNSHPKVGFMKRTIIPSQVRTRGTSDFVVPEFHGITEGANDMQYKLNVSIAPLLSSLSSTQSFPSPTAMKILAVAFTLASFVSLVYADFCSGDSAPHVGESCDPTQESPCCTDDSHIATCFGKKAGEAEWGIGTCNTGGGCADLADGTASCVTADGTPEKV